MSMYGMVFGQSGAADTLLGVLGLSRSDFYRYRDCYLTEVGEIAVYTRGGGNNRECPCHDIFSTCSHEGDCDDAGHDEGCVEPTQQANRAHPCYLRDEDDDFDNTYATFYFRVPAETDREALAGIQPEIARNDAWLKFIAALEKVK